MKAKYLVLILSVFVVACATQTEQYYSFSRSNPQTTQAVATITGSSSHGDKSLSTFDVVSIDGQAVKLHFGSAIKVAPGQHTFGIHAEKTIHPIKLAFTDTLVMNANVVAGHHYIVTGTVANEHMTVWFTENGKRVTGMFTK